MLAFRTKEGEKLFGLFSFLFFLHSRIDYLLTDALLSVLPGSVPLFCATSAAASSAQEALAAATAGGLWQPVRI